MDPLAPLSVGNGEFAFTADITGMQTFSEAYETGIPLCTQSQWGWHSVPAPRGLTAADLVLEEYETAGRQVGYATLRTGQEELYDWLRENPHRLHLGRIRLQLKHANGDAVEIGDLRDLRQTLDLWTGVLQSEFRVDGEPVLVKTACHPKQDLLAFEIDSPLLADGRLAVALDFPYGSPAMNAADWTQAERHQSKITSQSARRCNIIRVLDQTRYFVTVGWTPEASLVQEGPHSFVLRAAGGTKRLSAVFRFAGAPQTELPPSAEETIAASTAHWASFWSSGGAVELEAGPDKRASELERRIILSQYLTAIQCAGTLPPQETGLTCNSWYGKFHLEMHFWHAAHFALWGRIELLEKSLDWYSSILPSAREKARQQGYRGARWPKMCGPEGDDSPSPIGPLLIWQQPHPILYAELCYRRRPTQATVRKFREIVFESAEFMASFATWNEQRGCFWLGPPVIPAQEIHQPRETWNPTFELAYWAFGLEIAQQWRERLKMPRHPDWERVRQHLAPLPVKEGVYLAHENCPDFSSGVRDHPSMLAALGVLPETEQVSHEVMKATLSRIMKEWKWETTWGWDYPMVAMTAARLGDPETAVNALLIDTPKNRYLLNGHNYQRPGLPLYLPGNGGLLLATGMMAGGWEGGPSRSAPGFPPKWRVRVERLARWL